MKRFVMTLATIFMVCLLYGQVTIEDYIKSFPSLEGRSIVNLYDLYKQQRIKMTKEEALNYVLNGDTTKLYCLDLEYEGWEEKVYGKSIGEYYPLKCARVDYGNYFLICYETTECDDNGVWHKLLMTLEIFDKYYQKKDSLLVLKRDDHDTYIESLYNPQNHKLYLTDDLKESILYTINEKTLKFEELIRYDGNEIYKSSMNEYLKKQIQELGWEELFYSDDCQQ
ncbi:MAG: hypothetical protein J6U13_02940 [Salinivirgaceae bacterium]|nr:hypothetical protein [Salinivirgaceae bacterium]